MKHIPQATATESLPLVGKDGIYAPPQADLELPTVDSVVITDGMIEQLRRTAGWLRWISVLVLVSFVMMTVLAVPAMFDLARWRVWDAFLEPELVPHVAYGLLGGYLWRASSAIRRAVQSGIVTDVGSSLRMQRRAWLCAGIIAAVACAKMLTGQSEVRTLAGMVDTYVEKLQENLQENLESRASQ